MNFVVTLVRIREIGNSDRNGSESILNVIFTLCKFNQFKRIKNQGVNNLPVKFQ